MITPGSTADVKALKMFQFSFEKESKIYGDEADNDDCFETGLEKALGIERIPKRKKNSLRCVSKTEPVDFSRLSMRNKEWIEKSYELKDNLSKEETICFIDGVHPTYNVQPF